MNATTKKTIELLQILPESDQGLAYEIIKKLVLAWDPDYTKTTPEEARALEEAEHDIKAGDTISHDSIEW
jgi:precorrin isomerase